MKTPLRLHATLVAALSLWATSAQAELPPEDARRLAFVGHHIGIVESALVHYEAAAVDLAAIEQAVASTLPVDATERQKANAEKQLDRQTSERLGELEITLAKDDLDQLQAAITTRQEATSTDSTSEFQNSAVRAEILGRARKARPGVDETLNLWNTLIDLDYLGTILTQSFETLDELPQDEPEVISTKSRLEQTTKRKENVDNEFRLAHKRAATADAVELNANLENPLIKGELATFPYDLERCQQIRQAYAQRLWFDGDPELLVPLWTQLAPSRAWVEQIEAYYSPILQAEYNSRNQAALLGEQDSLRTEVTQAKAAFDSFTLRSQRFIEQSSVSLLDALGQVESITEDAKRQKSPQRLATAVRKREKVERTIRSFVLAAEPPLTTPEILRRYDQLVTAHRSLATQIDQELIDQAALPNDVYAGTDRPYVKLLVEEAFKKALPNEKIEAIRFDTTLWRDAHQGLRWQPATQRWLEEPTRYLDLKVLLPAAHSESRLDVVQVRVSERGQSMLVDIMPSEIERQIWRDTLEPNAKAAHDNIKLNRRIARPIERLGKRALETLESQKKPTQNQEFAPFVLPQRRH